jgi:hypothetical protein
MSATTGRARRILNATLNRVIIFLAPFGGSYSPNFQLIHKLQLARQVK